MKQYEIIGKILSTIIGMTAVLFIILLTLFIIWIRQAEAATLPEIQAISVPTLIEQIGKGEGLTEYEIIRLKSISYCESRWNPKAQNSISTAAGAFQIIHDTWKANSSEPWSMRYDVRANVSTGIKLYLKSGFQPWTCK